jgi:predicted dehydrogenase
MEKTRILLAGAAFCADLHMDGYKRLTDKTTIVAIVDKNKEKVAALAQRYGLSGFATYDDYEKAIAEVDCDIVDICMPNFLHHAVAMAALKKGRHVICEKPLATKVADGIEMIETAEKVGKKIYYAEDWLAAPALTKAQELIAQGGIGDVVFFRARECHNGSHSPFTQTVQYCGGGVMIHLGIHPIAYLLATKNCDWTELIAMTSGGSEKNLIHKKLEGEDWAAALMRFEDGTTAVLEGNYVTQGGMEDVIDFYGTKGCLHVDLTLSSAVSAFSLPGFDYTVEKADITTGWSRPAVDEKFNLGYMVEIEHFIDCAQKGIDARKGLRGIDGLEALKVLDLIYKSAREGVKITNPKIK